MWFWYNVKGYRARIRIIAMLWTFGLGLRFNDKVYCYGLRLTIMVKV